MRNVSRWFAVAILVGLAGGAARAEPGAVPAWYPAEFPWIPTAEAPGDDVGWPSMECATVITLRYARPARDMYLDLADASEAAGWRVRRRSDPEFDYRFDARLGRLEVLAMFDATGPDSSLLTLYVLELGAPEI